MRDVVLLTKRRNFMAKLVVWLVVMPVFWFSSMAVAGTVSDLRFGIDAHDQTRIVIEFSERPDYTLKVEQVGAKKQMVLTLRQATFAIGGAPRQAGTGKGLGEVVGYRYTSSGTTGTVIFGLSGTALPIEDFIMSKTVNKPVYRLVIDMKSVSNQKFLANITEAPKKTPEALPEIAGKTTEQAAPTKAPVDAPVSAPKPAPVAIVEAPPAAPAAKTTAKTAADLIAEQVKKAAEDERQAQQLAADIIPVPTLNPARRTLPRRKGIKVVIDAGHGGRDPGSVGKSGLYEKQVTLASAKELSRQLSKRGYKVIMTRNDDSYIELEDRAVFARDQKADLFISLHADSIKASKVRGASVYTLDDEGSDRFAKKFLSQGNPRIKGAAVPTGVVGSIVLNVAQSSSADQSSLLAIGIIKELKGLVPMVNNTHREADLNVLLDPDTPAVLLEMGFMSNAMDEANLKSKKWREKTMAGVASAIDSYCLEAAQPARCGRLSLASSLGSAGGK